MGNPGKPFKHFQGRAKIFSSVKNSNCNRICCFLNRIVLKIKANNAWGSAGMDSDKTCAFNNGF